MLQIAGVVFPVPILLLIPAREYLLPRIFGRKNLAVLDPAPYETSEGLPERRETQHMHSQESRTTSQETASPSPRPAANGGLAEDPSVRVIDRAL